MPCSSSLARSRSCSSERAPSALESATMRAISRARPVAPSSDSSSRLEKRLSRCSMSAVRVERGGKLPEVQQRLVGDGVERADVLIDLAAGHAASLGDLVHGADEL